MYGWGGLVVKWQKIEDEEFLKSCLKRLGLCEKKGLDGQVMLYPQVKKERKLEKDEFNAMVNRLYQVKKTADNDFIHVPVPTRYGS